MASTPAKKLQSAKHFFLRQTERTDLSWLSRDVEFTTMSETRTGGKCLKICFFYDRGIKEKRTEGFRRCPLLKVMLRLQCVSAADLLILTHTLLPGLMRGFRISSSGQTALLHALGTGSGSIRVCGSMTACIG